jgi:hypothetical protein
MGDEAWGLGNYYLHFPVVMRESQFGKGEEGRQRLAHVPCSHRICQLQKAIPHSAQQKILEHTQVRGMVRGLGFRFRVRRGCV